MKNLVKRLPLAGFILAIVAAFAFNEPAENTAWFDLDPEGNVGQEIADPSGCLGEDEYCAVEFNESDLGPNRSAPISKVEDPPQNVVQDIAMTEATQ